MSEPVSMDHSCLKIIKGPIHVEGNAVGAGYTDEHLKGRENEDRAIIINAPSFNENSAKRFLRTLFKNIAVKTQYTQGGSTLTALLKMENAGFAAAHVGDSPIFLVAENPNTKEVQLVTLGLAHNHTCEIFREWLDDLEPEGRNHEQILQDLIGLKGKNLIDTALNNVDDTLSRWLGITKNGVLHKADVYTIDPISVCPIGFVPKAMLVCSDGVWAAAEKGHIAKALEKLFAHVPNPKLETIAQLINFESKRFTSDNITTTVMPMDAPPGTLIAVADGHNRTADVAHKAVSCIREYCLERPGTMLDTATDIEQITSVKAPKKPSQNSRE